jgi:outer membrane protein assembly factor BamB
MNKSIIIKYLTIFLLNISSYSINASLVDGTMFLGDRGNLYSFDLDNNTSTSLSNLNVGTIAFSPTGEMFVGDNGGLYSFDLDNNTSTLLSNLNVRTIAFSPIPTPATVWLFCFGLIGLIGVAGRNAPLTIQSKI